MYRRRVLNAPASEACRPWSTCKPSGGWCGGGGGATTTSLGGLGTSSCPANYFRGCKPGFEPQGQPPPVSASKGAEEDEVSMKKQHRRMLRKLKCCMARTGSMVPTVHEKLAEVPEKNEDTSKFSCRSFRYGMSSITSSRSWSLESISGFSPALSACSAKEMLASALFPYSPSLSPRSSCAGSEVPPSSAEGEGGFTMSEYADEEQDEAAWAASMAHEMQQHSRHSVASLVPFWALLLSSICIAISFLARLVLLVEAVVVRRLGSDAGEASGDSGVLGDSQISPRLDSLLRMLVLASISFMAGMGLSALQPAVHPMHTVLLLGI